MEIVIEETLTVSVLLNFIILKTTAQVLKRRGRLTILSALFGGLVTLFSPLLILSAWLKLFLIIPTALIMLLVTFKYKNLKDFVVLFGVFMITTFLFGGGCFALKELIGSYPLYIVALVSIAIYICTYLIIKVVNHYRRIKNFTYTLTFKDGEKVISEKAYLDSGNMLYDSITKKPIVLINYDVFQKFYKDISLVSILTKKVNSSSIKNGHYIKINSVGKGTSILVFTTDEMKVEGDERLYKNVTLGLSFSGFEKSFGSNVLLHCDYS